MQRSRERKTHSIFLKLKKNIKGVGWEEERPCDKAGDKAGVILCKDL